MAFLVDPASINTISLLCLKQNAGSSHAFQRAAMMLIWTFHFNDAKFTTAMQSNAIRGRIFNTYTPPLGTM